MCPKRIHFKLLSSMKPSWPGTNWHRSSPHSCGFRLGPTGNGNLVLGTERTL